LSDTFVRRCHACGGLNAGAAPACVSCGTLVPAAAAPIPATAASAPQAPAAPAHGLGGVARLFVVLLVLSAADMIAAKAGAPPAKLDVVDTAIFACIALLCGVAARADVAPLLARTGGWRGLGFALAGLGFLVAFGSVYFPAFRRLGFDYLKMTDPYLEAGWPTWTAYVLVSITPAVFEELTFRGYVMARLAHLLSSRETLVVQAALFSLIHLGVVIFPSHFVIGLVLGVIRRRTGSLYPGMAVHMAWNGLLVWAELTGRAFM
jgi:membrane protease YdiL (CAAX protease family)